MKKLLKTIQYFFWLLAGSDIALLKKCATDQNRHANVGLAIFTTTVVAFVTGSLAGFQFSTNSDDQVHFAFFFGMLWCLLVFTIDRNMVLTLKKDPTRKKQQLLVPLIYRIFLSGLISFFISIPLELWIFGEEIKIQMVEDDDRKVLAEKGRLSLIYDLDALSNIQGALTEKLSSIEEEMNLAEPPTRRYKTAKDSMEIARNRYNNYLAKYNRKIADRQQWWGKWLGLDVNTGIFDTLSTGEVVERIDKIRNLAEKDRRRFKNHPHHDKWWQIFKSTRQNPDGPETITLNSLRRNYNKIEGERTKIYEEYYISKQAEIAKQDSVLNRTVQKLGTNQQVVVTKVARHDTLTRQTSGFISQWVALNNLHVVDEGATPNEKTEAFWILFFIWFIRVVFFTIELLPTLAKFTTPVGAYDWVLFEEEQKQKELFKREKELEFKESDHLSEVELEEKKIIKEKELLNLEKHILKNYFVRQNRIADKILEEWERKEIEHIDKDLDAYIDGKSVIG